MNDSKVQSINANEYFHMDTGPEKRNPSFTMAIGNEDIPAFLKDVGGCRDPDIVKVAVIDGGIDKDHDDFNYCGQGYCEGRRFMSPADQDWGESTNDHGSHVA